MPYAPGVRLWNGRAMPDGPIVTPEQCRAARGLLDWSQADLAEAAHVVPATIRGLERGKTTPRRLSAEAIRAALENAGVIFLDGTDPGVRLRNA